MLFGLDTIFVQLVTDFKLVFEYFKGSLISTIFFVVLISISILNIIKKALIWQEKKANMKNKTCEFLIQRGNQQDCDILSRRQRFIDKGRSCKGCKGRSIKMSDAEAENRIKKGGFVKYLLIMLADGGRSLLPYISFCYTLVIAIFEHNK